MEKKSTTNSIFLRLLQTSWRLRWIISQQRRKLENVQNFHNKKRHVLNLPEKCTEWSLLAVLCSKQFDRNERLTGCIEIALQLEIWGHSIQIFGKYWQKLAGNIKVNHATKGDQHLKLWHCNNYNKGYIAFFTFKINNSERLATFSPRLVKFSRHGKVEFYKNLDDTWTKPTIHKIKFMS